MNITEFAAEKGLQQRIETALNLRCLEHSLLDRISSLPIKKSHAVRRLGSYVARRGEPVEIRLQFALEEHLLIETFLHELAHCLDHLTNQAGQPYRRAHGKGWQEWAVALGIVPSRCGVSAALNEIHEKRLKVVAVCKKCGFELKRLKRLARNRKYIHPECGGRLKLV